MLLSGRDGLFDSYMNFDNHIGTVIRIKPLLRRDLEAALARARKNPGRNGRGSPVEAVPVWLCDEPLPGPANLLQRGQLALEGLGEPVEGVADVPGHGRLRP